MNLPRKRLSPLHRWQERPAPPGARLCARRHRSGSRLFRASRPARPASLPCTPLPTEGTRRRARHRRPRHGVRSAARAFRPGQDRHDHLGHRDRRLAARRARRQRRLPWPQDDQLTVGWRRHHRRGRHLSVARRRRRTSAASTTSTPSSTVQVAKGAFWSPAPLISPKRGPIGTTITVTYTGLGSSLYEAAARSCTTTSTRRRDGQLDARRGLGHPRGRPGRHAHDRDRGRDQLQVPEHRAVADPVGDRLQVHFTVTGDNGRPEARIDWPAEVTPTVAARTTLAVRASAAAHGGGLERDGRRHGEVAHRAGLTPNAPVELEWSTVVGNRVNCTGTCWRSCRFRSAPARPRTAR